jgi:uncharacterized membrane protein
MSHLVAFAAVLACAGLAAFFRPLQTLRTAALRSPWLACLVLLPWLWNVPLWLPRGLPALQFSGACLLTLMFGWPLAVWTLVLVAAIAAVLGGWDWTVAIDHAAWDGVLPASAALGFGLLARRWLPPQPFSYMLGRAFAATLAALVVVRSVQLLTLPLPPQTDPLSLWLGRWLISWGEAVATGMLASACVVWRPQWLATWSDQRYMPPRR